MIVIPTPYSCAFRVITTRFRLVNIHKTNCFVLNAEIHIMTSDLYASSVVAARTYYICHLMLPSKIDNIDGCLSSCCRPTNQSLTGSFLFLLSYCLIAATHPKDNTWNANLTLDKTATKCTCRRVYILNLYQDSNRFLPSFLASGGTQPRPEENHPTRVELSL